MLVLRLLSYMCTFAKQPAVEFSYTYTVAVEWKGAVHGFPIARHLVSFWSTDGGSKGEKGRAKFPWRGANHEEAWPTTAQTRHLGIGTPHEDSSMKYNRSCLHVRLCCRDGEAMRFHFLLIALWVLISKVQYYF